MTAQKRMTQAQRTKVRSLREQGKSITDIAAAVGFSRASVHAACKDIEVPRRTIAGLSEEDMAAIRAAYKAGGTTYDSLARDYEVSRETIRQVVTKPHNKYWPEDRRSG